MTWAGERVTRNLGTVTRRVNAIIDAAAAAAGIDPAVIVVVQGSWASGSASAGTHSGGGAADLRTWNLPAAKIEPLVVELRRRCGGPAWYRDAAHGGFDPHIHVIVRDEPGLAGAAQEQVQFYDAGYDGLARMGRDYHPRPSWARFPFTPPPRSLTGADKAWLTGTFAPTAVT
jgi:hypothetical protein